MSTSPLHETSSFTHRDEKWFASVPPPPRAKRPTPSVPPIGDPMADRWFR